MQALPPPPAYHCVKTADAAAAHVTMMMTVGAEPSQVEAWLVEVKSLSVWKIDADAQANGIRFIRLSRPGDMPYREIGGLIYDGQARHLSVSFVTEPPICETEEQ